jgi:hypothetical protein
MAKKQIDFAKISEEIDQVTKLRESVITDAFIIFERMREPLAQLLLLGCGDRRRAAIWMCSRHRAFSGHTAYQFLAVGDEDAVWSEAAKLARVDIPGNF